MARSGDYIGSGSGYKGTNNNTELLRVNVSATLNKRRIDKKRRCARNINLVVGVKHRVYLAGYNFYLGPEELLLKQCLYIFLAIRFQCFVVIVVFWQ